MYAEELLMGFTLYAAEHVLCLFRFKEVFYDETYLAIVMEYASQGHLSSMLERHGRLSETDARRYNRTPHAFKCYQALWHLYDGPVEHQNDIQLPTKYMLTRHGGKIHVIHLMHVVDDGSGCNSFVCRIARSTGIIAIHQHTKVSPLHVT